MLFFSTPTPKESQLKNNELNCIHKTNKNKQTKTNQPKSIKTKQSKPAQINQSKAKQRKAKNNN